VVLPEHPDRRLEALGLREASAQCASRQTKASEPFHLPAGLWQTLPLREKFVTAVLLVAIFWELCKINGQLKRSIPQISERGQADDADKNRAASPAR
jgi:hypothetical protein